MRRWLNSLIKRLVLASLLLLPLFMGLTAYALYQAFQSSVFNAKQQQLLLQSYILLGAAEIASDSVSLPAVLQEPRFSQLQSGLYGFVSSNGRVLWQSQSSRGQPVNDLTADSLMFAYQPGKAVFNVTEEYFIYSYPVIWELDSGQEQQLLFSVVEQRQSNHRELASFVSQLGYWLGASTIALILVQLWVLRWGTRPLKVLTGDLKAMEQGDKEQLEGDYPVELQPMADNLNKLITTERRQRERYRTTLSDLAHSLKTPLAVIRGELSDVPDNVVISDQVDRMQDIVGHQLSRSVNQTRGDLHKPVVLSAILDKLCRALSKVYQEKSPYMDNTVDPALTVVIDERDLMEVLGNILDNACKACRYRVAIMAQQQTDGLQISIDDDGDGIEEGLRSQVLQRGLRADSRHSGQGIGLAVASDIIDNYQGQLAISDSVFGGARFTINLPNLYCG